MTSFGGVAWVWLLVFWVAIGGCGQSNLQRVQVPTGVLDAFAGEYQPAPDTVATVARAGDHLEMQVNHQPPMSFVAETGETFLHPASSTRIRFVTNNAGQVTRLILIRNGQESEAKRILQRAAREPIRTANIGGVEFRFLASGSGQPTVLLWGGTDSWSKVQRGLATSARTVSFDRSIPATTPAASIPRTPSDAARELHDALKKGELAPPYILVGHSFGGALVRVFASLYPTDVVGIVLVDPFQEEFVDWLKVNEPELHDQFVARLRKEYVSDWEGTVTELRVASSFTNLPVVLMSAVHRRPQTGDAFERSISPTALTEGSEAIVQAHQEWLARIPRGRHVAVEGSSHDIPGERPGAVVEAIKTLMAQAGTSRP